MGPRQGLVVSTECSLPSSAQLTLRAQSWEGEPEEKGYLARVLATLQESNANHVIGDLSWVRVRTLTGRKYRSVQALQEIRAVRCGKQETIEKKAHNYF